jgi:hypothetical protein
VRFGSVIAVLAVVGLAGPMLPALADRGARAVLRANGLGTVRFGTSKVETVQRLSALLGPPTWRAVNPGCGPRWTEVVYEGRLAAEFRSGTFTGYRYAAASHIAGMFGAPRGIATPAFPSLTTAAGVSVGDTLAQVRAAYPGALRFAGTDRHRTLGGVVFVDDAQRSPASLSSRIIEIKTAGTCGDF